MFLLQTLLTYPCAVHIVVNPAEFFYRFFYHSLHALLVCHINWDHNCAIVWVGGKAFTLLGGFLSTLLIEVGEDYAYSSRLGEGEGSLATYA